MVRRRAWLLAILNMRKRKRAIRSAYYSRKRGRKQKIVSALCKIADPDTYQIAIKDLENIMQSLSPETLPTFLDCLYDSCEDSKPCWRKECLRLFLCVCSLHSNSTAAHLSGIIPKIVEGLYDSDSGVREACQYTFGALSGIYLKGKEQGSNTDAASSLVSLFVKPLFEAMRERDIVVQSGAAMCMVRMVESAASPPASFQMLSSRICKRLRSSIFLAKASLLHVVSSLSQVGAIAPKSLDSLLESIHDCLQSRDWETRKAAADTLTALATHSSDLIKFKTKQTLSLLCHSVLDEKKLVRKSAREAELLWQKIYDSVPCSIAKLQDEMLCQILSYLPTKCSVSTSVLCRRWRNLWLQVPVLELNSSSFRDQRVFMEVMDRFVKHWEGVEIKRFALSYYAEEPFVDVSGLWINHVITGGVFHLHIEISNEWEDSPEVRMPQSMYTCKTLENLHLEGVVLDEPESVLMPSVKVMHLVNVRYATDSHLEMLISSCLVLEELSIIREEYDDLETIRVCSESLKRLTLEAAYILEGSDNVVEIDCPRLEYMRLSDWYSKSIIIQNIGPSAVVDIDVECGTGFTSVPDSYIGIMLRNFLIQLSTVRSMKMSASTLEVLDKCRSELVSLPQFSNLSSLEASLYGNECSWDFLSTFFSWCPNLQSLILDQEFDSVTEAKQIEFSHVPQRFFSTLKFVKLKTLTDTSSIKMTLASYFLKNCDVLEKLTLSRAFDDIITKIKKIKKKSSLGCEIVLMD